MSTRASLLANPEGRAKELAECTYTLPLLWLPLFGPDDVTGCSDDSCTRPTTDRKAAVARLANSLELLGEMFPEATILEEAGERLLAVLRRTRAKTIGVDLGDHAAMSPGRFLPDFGKAVEAIDAGDESQSELLCVVTGFDPDEADEDVLSENLIGYLG